MLAVCPITSLPAFRNGGANGGVPACLHHLHHRGHAALAARDIGIVGARIFQREADIFAAALNARPVIEFIAHGRPRTFTSCTALTNH
jgi:hypothetical protein